LANTPPDPERSSTRCVIRTQGSASGTAQRTAIEPPLRALATLETPAGFGRSASISARTLATVDDTPLWLETTSHTYDKPYERPFTTSTAVAPDAVAVLPPRAEHDA
jgi:hypothetical protein